MSDIIVLLESAGTIGWVILCAVLAVSLGMLVFDRKVGKRARTEGKARPGQRTAA